MIHIIAGCYKPNIAATMRLLSLTKGLARAGVNFHLVFVYPNEKLSTIDSNDQVYDVIYLWEKHPIKNRYLKYLFSFYDISRYVSKLPRGSMVLLINANEYLSTVVRYRKKVKVYVETNEYPLLGKLLPSYLRKNYLKNCVKVDGMFVISSALKEFYEEMGVKNVKVLNMVVDPDRFLSLSKTSNSEKYIAYCGSATNNKDGVDILIKAFAFFKSSHPDYKLYIIGRTPAFSDDQSNMRLVQELGLEENVVFTGELPSQEIPQMLKDAVMLVLARPDNIQAKYGFPTKLGEYLLTGNPVVVTDVGDITVFLKDKENALVAKPNDCNSFADKMSWVIDNNDLAIEIGLKGRETALKHFNGETEARKIIDK